MAHPRNTVSVELESQSYLQRQWWDYLAPQRNWGHVFSAHKLLTIPRVVPLSLLKEMYHTVWISFDQSCYFPRIYLYFNRYKHGVLNSKKERKRKGWGREGEKRSFREKRYRKERGRRRNKERSEGLEEEAEDKTVMGRDTKSKEGGGKGGRSRKEGVQHKKSEKGKRKKKKAREKG